MKTITRFRNPFIQLFSINLIISSFLILFFDLSYSDNDDIIMSHISEGIICNTNKNWHLVYIHPIIGSILYYLNKLIDINWYPVFMLLTTNFSIALIFSTININSVYKKILLYVFYFPFLLFFLFHIQFTTTSSLLCLSSLIMFQYSNFKSKFNRIFLTVILVSISSLIRSDSTILILIIYSIILISTQLLFNKTSVFKFKADIYYFLVFVFFSFLIGESRYNLDENWKTFIRYNKNRSAICDSGENQIYTLMNKTDILELNLGQKAIGLSSKFPSVVDLEKINRNKKTIPFLKDIIFKINMFKYHFSQYSNYTYFKILGLVIFLYLIVFKLDVKTIKYNCLNIIIGFAIVSLVLLIYNRLVPRVTISCFLPFIYFFVKNIFESELKINLISFFIKSKILICSFIIVSILFVSFFTYKKLKTKQTYSTENILEEAEYINSKSHNNKILMFFLNNPYYKFPLFYNWKTKPNANNLIFTGWICQTPYQIDQLKHNGINQDIYLKDKLKDVLIYVEPTKKIEDIFGLNEFLDAVKFVNNTDIRLIKVDERFYKISFL